MIQNYYRRLQKIVTIDTNMLFLYKNLFMIDFDQIALSPLFRNLPKKNIERLLKVTNYQVKRYPPKATILSQGAACNFAMIILKGNLQGQMLDYSGKFIVIEELHSPMLIAPAFIYAERNEMPVNVVALEESNILFIHKTDFTTLLQKNETVLQNFLTIISNRGKFLSEKILFLSFKNLKGKIAAFLLQKYKEQQNKKLTISETQQELADYLGVARPSLSRVLGQMKEEGIIAIQRKKIMLLNLSALKQSAQ